MAKLGTGLSGGGKKRKSPLRPVPRSQTRKQRGYSPGQTQSKRDLATKHPTSPGARTFAQKQPKTRRAAPPKAPRPRTEKRELVALLTGQDRLATRRERRDTHRLTVDQRPDLDRLRELARADAADDNKIVRGLLKFGKTIAGSQSGAGQIYRAGSNLLRGKPQKTKLMGPSLEDVGKARQIPNVAKGVAKGYYHKPTAVIKDVETAADSIKALPNTAYALLTPNKLADTVKEDYARRYKGRGKQLEKNVEKIVRTEGGLSYLLDAAPVATAAGKGAGVTAKGATALSTGKVGRGVNRWLTKERPHLRTSGNQVRRQRNDEARKTAPNVFRLAGQRGIDAARRKRFERRDSAAKKESLRTGTNVRPALRPEADEVLPFFKSTANRAQRKSAARVKAQNRNRMFREQHDAERAAAKATRKLTRHERMALSFVYEGVIPANPAGAVRYMKRRLVDIGTARIRAERETGRKHPTMFQSNEERVINKLLKKPEKAFTQRVAEAADALRRLDHEKARGNPALPFGRRMATRYGPQAEVLGVRRGERTIHSFDDEASRKSFERHQRKMDKREGVVRTAPAKPSRDRTKLQSLLERLRNLADPKRGGTAGERAAASAKAKKIEDELGATPKTPPKRTSYDEARGARRPSTKRPETDAEYYGRVRGNAARENLRVPGYVPHSTKAGDTNFASRAVGGAKATDYFKRTLRNFREGRVDRRPSAITEGLMRTIKTKHQWRAVTEMAREHRMPKYSGVPLREAVERLERDGINPAEVGIYFPRKATKYARDAGDGGVEIVDNLEEAHAAFAKASASPKNAQELRALLDEFADEKAVVVPKAAYDEIMSSTKPSGKVGRAVDVANTKLSRAVLGLNVPWVAVDGISGAAALAVMNHQVPLGPSFWKAQEFFRKMDKPGREIADMELGLGVGGRRGWLLHQPRMGSTANGVLARHWRMFRQTPIGRVRPIGAPIDAFMRFEQKFAVEPFRKAAAYKLLQREAAARRLTDNIGRLNAAQNRLQRLYKLDPEGQIRELIENPAVIHDVARSVEAALGDWTTLTATERNAIARVTFFYPYMRYSLRTLFYTMPVEHPIVTSVLAQLSRLEADEVKEMLGGELPWSLGKIYYEKDGQLMQFDLAKRANFLTNAVVGADATNQWIGALSPMFQIAASQMNKSNMFVGRNWQVEGYADSGRYDDLPMEKKLEVRARVFARDVLNLAFPVRIANTVTSSGAKEGDDSHLLLGRRYIKYKRPDKVQEQAKRVAEKKQNSTFEQIGQAMGLLPKRSYDRELVAQRKGGSKSTKTGNPLLDDFNKFNQQQSSGNPVLDDFDRFEKKQTSQAKPKPKTQTASRKTKPRTKATASTPAASPPRQSAKTVTVADTSSGSSRSVKVSRVSSVPKGAKTYGASTFGGSGDPGTGHIGYRGDDLNKKPDSFAELSNDPQNGVNADFAAMGGLEYGTKVRVTNPKTGKSMILTKRDVGAGGGAVNGHKRAIDIWHVPAKKLGINGLAAVKVEVLTGKHKGKVIDTGTGDTQLASTPTRTPAQKAAIAEYLMAPKKPGALMKVAASLKESPDASIKTPKGAPASTSVSGVRVGGSSPKRAVQNVTHGVGLNGVTMTSGKRGRVTTASGNVSDHYIGNKSAHAEDYAGSQKAMDRFARNVAKALGIKGYKPGQIYNVTKNGYRYQLIWKTADHMDHVHLGAKRL